MEARQEVSELESEPAPSLPAPTSTQGRTATSWRGALVVRSKDTAQPWASRVPDLLGHTLCSGSPAPSSFCLANSHLSIWVLIWLSPPLGNSPGFAHFGFCMSPLCPAPPGMSSLGNLCFHLDCRQRPQGSEGVVFPSALPHSSFLAGSIHPHSFADSSMLG